MSEPVNPLFEEEKEFLERKMLEYERALQGDVEHIKDQTVQVGKIALVGAGVVGGIWLLRKVFGRRKRQEWHHAQPDGDEAYDADYDGFGGDDDYDEPTSRSKWNDYATEDEYFPSSSLTDSNNDDDDNGLGDFPDFAAHSSREHGRDDGQPDSDDYDAATSAGVYHAHGPETDDNEPRTRRSFWSEEHSHPSANLPYDDSRRMPGSTSFAAAGSAATHYDSDDDAQEATYASASRKSWMMPAIMSFLQSETGRVLTAQVVTVALALVTKAVKDVLPSDEAEPAKNSDLAAPTAVGARPYGQTAPKAEPQSPVSDAQDPDTDAPTYHSLA